MRSGPEPSVDLAWLDAQAPAMRRQVVELANVNSGTFNLPGVARTAELLMEAFAGLGGQASLLDVQPMRDVDEHGRHVERALGKALQIVKRPDAPLRVLLSAHLDTVYPPDHPFQSCTSVNEHTLRGPGVADIKGGIVVMLKALEALERSDVARRIGWTVLLNPDEEVGSPGSHPLLADAARRHDVGLVFEPTLPDGAMASSRKGAGNFSIVVRGRAAHAGRDFEHGRNAMHALARMVVGLADLTGVRPGLTVNVARVDGGGPVNIVPDVAIARLNVRVTGPDDQAYVLDAMRQAAEQVGSMEGYSAELVGRFQSPPKLLDAATQRLIDHVDRAGRTLGMTLQWQATGGTCDGNKLAAAGLPNIDTMGVRGGDIHSTGEFLVVDSLVERAKLAAQVLVEFAADPQRWKRSNA